MFVWQIGPSILRRVKVLTARNARHWGMGGSDRPSVQSLMAQKAHVFTIIALCRVDYRLTHNNNIDECHTCIAY